MSMQNTRPRRKFPQQAIMQTTVSKHPATHCHQSEVQSLLPQYINLYTGAPLTYNTEF